jgi:hypothetical protein
VANADAFMKGLAAALTEAKDIEDAEESGPQPSDLASQSSSVSERDDEAPASENDPSVTSFLPAQMTGKRYIKRLEKAVSAWEPQEDLGAVELRKLRQGAVACRFANDLTPALRLQMGRFLLDAKRRLKHGDWQSFLKSAAGVSRANAARLIAVADAIGDVNHAVLLGDDLIDKIFKARAPVTVLDSICAAKTREEAGAILDTWKNQAKITAVMAPVAGAEKLPEATKATLAAKDIPAALRELATRNDDPEAVVTLFRETLTEVGTPVAATNIVRQKTMGRQVQRPLNLSSFRRLVEDLSEAEGLEEDEELSGAMAQVMQGLERLVQLTDTRRAGLLTGEQ